MNPLAVKLQMSNNEYIFFERKLPCEAEKVPLLFADLKGPYKRFRLLPHIHSKNVKKSRAKVEEKLDSVQTVSTRSVCENKGKVVRRSGKSLIQFKLESIFTWQAFDFFFSAVDEVADLLIRIQHPESPRNIETV